MWQFDGLTLEAFVHLHRDYSSFWNEKLLNHDNRYLYWRFPGRGHYPTAYLLIRLHDFYHPRNCEDKILNITGIWWIFFLAANQYPYLYFICRLEAIQFRLIFFFLVLFTALAAVVGINNSSVKCHPLFFTGRRRFWKILAFRVRFDTSALACLYGNPYNKCHCHWLGFSKAALCTGDPEVQQTKPPNFYCVHIINRYILKTINKLMHAADKVQCQGKHCIFKV